MTDPIKIDSEDQWHTLRAKAIGGSEVAALFGASPYLTHWSLWHEKAGLIKPEREESTKMRWGKMLEPLIAQEIGRTLNWTLVPARTYHYHPRVPGMGCTLDFDVLDHQDGPGIVETKVVFDYQDYLKDWSDERAPPNYELQVQQQLACTGLGWVATVVWIAQTASLQPALMRKRNDSVVAEIEKRVTAFWASIAANEPPPATGTDDEWSAMKQLWPARAERKRIEFDDKELGEAAQMLLWASDQLPGIQREKDARRAQLLGAARDAEILKVPGHTVYIKQNKRGAITMEVRADGGPA